MKVYDTMDLPKGKEKQGFQAPFSAFSPKFDALCYSMIERQDFFSLLAWYNFFAEKPPQKGEATRFADFWACE